MDIFSIVSEMLRRFDPSIKGRGFFKRTGKEILTQKLNDRARGLKKTTHRIKKVDEYKKKTEASLVKKSEKMKRLKAEFDAL